MRHAFFLFIAAVGCFTSRAQESITPETNPPSLKWFQINTPNFRVLFPEGFEVQAQRMANTLEHIREPEAASMGVKPKKISVLLQSQSSQSNGFVTLAPRRSEFFAMPTQEYNFTGTNEWLNGLAAHEYRHIVQFQRSITGFNKFVYYALGQRALAGLSFVAAPQWFWEGDAVATETAFTQSGRGRIPNFDLLFRTNFLEGRTFNYHKQYLRSYKHNIPSHYVLGYHMVSYLRYKTGDPEIWEKIVRRAWNWPFIPFTFSNAIHKETGSHVVDLYRQMATDLKKKWKDEQQGLNITKFERVNPRKDSVYTDYQFPQVLSDGTVVAMKSGLAHIAQLVVLSEGREHKGILMGPVNQSGQLSSSNLRVVWNEFRYDPRYLVRNYTTIVGYDFGTGAKQTVVRHARYASAALSPDGYQVATVETDTNYKIKLLIVDYYSGQTVKEFDNPDNDFISMPRWSDDGKSIVALRLTKAGKAVTLFDVGSGTHKDLLPPSTENIGYPVVHGQYLFYNSPYSGIDNIYALDVQTGKKFQVTSAKYGAYNPAISPDGQTLYYNNQGRNGMDVVKIPLDPQYWKPLEAITTIAPGFYQHLVDQENSGNLFKTVPEKSYGVKKYSKLKGMINPHSWGPYTTSSLSYLDIGISSLDLLNTTSIDLGYRFDATERTGFWRAAMTYQGIFPILDALYTKGNRHSVRSYNDSTGTAQEAAFDWNEQTLEGGVRIPLLTTRSAYLSQVYFSNAVGLTHITNFKNNVDGGGRYFYDQLDNGNLIYNRFGFSAYRLLNRSRRDIYSRWGQYVTVDSYATPYGGDYRGNLFSFLGALYFPGFMRHHSLNGYWAYQKTLIDQKPDSYIFRNQVPTPRGQSVGRFEDFYSMSANYTFPIWYPDIAVGPVLNVQRLRGNLFTDYAFGKSTLKDPSGNEVPSRRHYTSIGADLKFDVNIMRFLQQIALGVRYSYAVEKGTSQVEFVVGNIGF